MDTQNKPPSANHPHFHRSSQWNSMVWQKISVTSDPVVNPGQMYSISPTPHPSFHLRYHRPPAFAPPSHNTSISIHSTPQSHNISTYPMKYIFLLTAVALFASSTRAASDPRECEGKNTCFRPFASREATTHTCILHFSLHESHDRYSRIHAERWPQR
jgi:hypothetical protein